MIVVLGSLNMDFVVRMEHLPAAGQTVLGRDFETLPGGKGANQAHAAARLGATVRMMGCVGRDAFGEQLKASLVSAGVDVSGVEAVETHPTGVALISVDAAGQNSIVVAPGANHAEIALSADIFRGARVALFQLETPLGTVRDGLTYARTAGATTILDPAPAQPLSRDLLTLVDIVTPNETEALLLLGRAPR
ncbi:MAG: ribokinase, partial [Acidobacteriota bacterium]|nr:ribokinase [Acidobacteriota bacterium]